MAITLTLATCVHTLPYVHTEHSYRARQMVVLILTAAKTCMALPVAPICAEERPHQVRTFSAGIPSTSGASLPDHPPARRALCAQGKKQATPDRHGLPFEASASQFMAPPAVQSYLQRVLPLWSLWPILFLTVAS